MSEPAEGTTARAAPRRGDRIEVVIEALDAKGRGVGRPAGGAAGGGGEGSDRERGADLRVSVRHAVPGSRVAARVGRRRGRRVEARLESVLDPGPETRDARCEHFGTCGGCSFQSTAYARQLVELRRLVESTLAAADVHTAVEPVIGCADPWRYRNKMDFTFSNRRWIEKGEPPNGARDASFALGLHVPGRFDKVLDLRGCAIHFEQADGLLADVRELAREADLAPWDVRNHTGLLRHLVLRKGVRSGEVMVDLVTSRDAPESILPLCERLCERHPEVTTFVQNVNELPASIAVGQREHVLMGPGTIREEVLGLSYTISANSFFQTNTLQAERLFEIVREEARCQGSEVLFDLYCGAGTIALSLSRDAGEVWGFESVPSAVADARRNATANAVANVRFVEGDVLAELGGDSGEPKPRPGICVVDPPRAGLHPKVIPALVGLAPRRIVYVSCNVRATARELPFFLTAGYRLTRVRPIDLFPHTPHVECVFTLEL